MNYINDLIKMIGGGKVYTEADCAAWLKNKNVNPQTGRKIGPTQSGRGIYHDLENTCIEKGIKPAKPAFVQPAPVRRTPEDKPIIRKGKGRKSPAISATSLPVGTKRMGEDGMYIIKLRANGSQYWQPCSQKTANC